MRRAILNAINGCLWLIGLAGVPGDIETWATWIKPYMEVIDSPLFRLVLIVLGLIFFYLINTERSILLLPRIQKLRSHLFHNKQAVDRNHIQLEQDNNAVAAPNAQTAHVNEPAQSLKQQEEPVKPPPIEVGRAIHAEIRVTAVKDQDNLDEDWVLVELEIQNRDSQRALHGWEVRANVANKVHRLSEKELKGSVKTPPPPKLVRDTINLLNDVRVIEAGGRRPGYILFKLPNPSHRAPLGVLVLTTITVNFLDTFGNTYSVTKQL